MKALVRREMGVSSGPPPSGCRLGENSTACYAGRGNDRAVSRQDFKIMK